ncbi:hypothetical protein ACE6H2_010406 [Prunus campanulata]
MRDKLYGGSLCPQWIGNRSLSLADWSCKKVPDIGGWCIKKCRLFILDWALAKSTEAEPSSFGFGTDVLGDVDDYISKEYKLISQEGESIEKQNAMMTLIAHYA